MEPNKHREFESSQRYSAYRRILGEADSRLAEQDWEGFLRRAARLNRMAFLLIVVSWFVSTALMVWVGSWWGLAPYQVGITYSAIFFWYVSAVSLSSAAENHQFTDLAPCTREQAPGLWAEIDAITSACGTRPMDRVYLVTQPWVNSNIISGKSILVLGVTTLAFLSPDEIRFMIAREVGRLSGPQARFAKTERQFSFTKAIMSRFRGGVAWFLMPYATWIEEHVTSLWHASYRYQAFVADRFAADRIGAEHLKGILKDPVAEHFYTYEVCATVTLNILAGAKPPLAVDTLVPERLDRFNEGLGVAYGNGLFRAKRNFETHVPNATDRYRALGLPIPEVTVDDIRPAEPNALSAFLGDHMMDVLRAVEAHNAKVYAQLFPGWEKPPQDAPPTPVEDFDLDEAMAKLDERRDDAELNYLVGSGLLGNADPRGLEFLARAKELDPDKTLWCDQAIAEYQLKTEGQIDPELEFSLFTPSRYKAQWMPPAHMLVASAQIEQFRHAFAEPLDAVSSLHLVAVPDPTGPAINVVVLFPRFKSFRKPPSYEKLCSDARERCAHHGLSAHVVVAEDSTSWSWRWRVRKVPDSVIYNSTK